MRIQLVIILLLAFVSAQAQKVINVRYPTVSPTISISPSVEIPAIASGYTLWLPGNKKPKGMMVFLEQNRDSLRRDELIKVSSEKGLAVIYVTTENPFELLADEKQMVKIGGDLDRVCTNFQIPKKNLLFVGSGLGGTRVMRLAIATWQLPNLGHLRPKAIAICDSPLDMSRVYNSNDRRLSSEGLDFELSDYLSIVLDGTPTNSKARFTNYSPYSKNVLHGGNAPYFTELPIRAYIDIGKNWTNAKQGQSDFDAYHFIEELKRLGNRQAVLVQSKMPRKAQSSWDLVNKRELVDWFARLCDQKE